MAQIDILLCIFPIKSNLMHGFTEVMRAHFAGVSVGNIEPTGVASIPAYMLFHDIGIKYVRALGNTISSQWAVSAAHGLRQMVQRRATRRRTLEASGGTLREQTRRRTAGAHRRRKTTTLGKPYHFGGNHQCTLAVRNHVPAHSHGLGLCPHSVHGRHCLR